MSAEPDVQRLRRAQRVLFAGEISDIPAMQRLLGELPWKVHGHIFIEAADRSEFMAATLPPRVAIHWLFRSERTRDDGQPGMPDPGQVLARAVAGWLAEWGDVTFDGDEDPESAAGVVWLGAARNRWTESMAVSLQHSATGLHWLEYGRSSASH